MTEDLVVIVDYDMGNVGSLLKMFRRIGSTVLVSHRVEDLEKASHMVLPGVGAFDKAITKISQISGLRELLVEKVEQQSTPLLGVCLGMQLLLNSSDEGPGNGFGWISGHVRKFKNSADHRVPHMGWNSISVHKEDLLLEGLDNRARFYFVHSFFADAVNSGDILATTSHGAEFASVVRRDNVMGVQFHPEKSHSFGMKVLRNFLKLTKC